MDDIICNRNEKKESLFPATGLYFIVLAVIFGLFVFIGFKLARSYDLVADLNYYNRYSGLGDSFELQSVIRHFTSAVGYSVPTLILIGVLFLLSFSPLLMPVGIIAAVVRGSVTGSALCTLRSPESLTQVCIYILCTAVIIHMCSVLLSFRKSGHAGLLPKKIVAFLMSSGICVAAEFIMSFIL